MQTVRFEVDHLLSMYTQYKELHECVGAAGRRLAKAKMRRENTTALIAAHSQLQAELQELSDAMTFANPTIWMLYKFEAYANEAQPIQTMHDFRVHCSKPGYICTKRYVFVNDSLVRRGALPLSDTSLFPDEMSLKDASNALAILEEDVVFMQSWSDYEYYRENGIVAKWAQY